MKVLTGSLVLLCMLPTYINIFVIYAISNLHDISWGNRPTTEKVSKKQVELKISYEVFRSRCLVAFVLANVAFAYIVIYLSRSNQAGYIAFVSVFVAFIVAVRLVFAVVSQCGMWKEKRELEAYKDSIRQPREESGARPQRLGQGGGENGM